MPPRSQQDRSPTRISAWPDDSSSAASSVEFKKSCPAMKQLRFADDDKNELHLIEHLDDIPEVEVAATWYNAQEYSAIKAAYQLTIFMMEAGEKLDGNEYTSRGLEYRTQEGAWARYENKRDAYNAVLDEQDRQWAVDKDDFEKIRQIYLKHSQKCADAAVVRALQDEREAKEYLKTIVASPAASSKPKLKKKVSDVSADGSTTKKSSTTKKDKDKSSTTTSGSSRPKSPEKRSKSPEKRTQTKSSDKSTCSEKSEKSERSKSPEKRSKSPDKARKLERKACTTGLRSKSPEKRSVQRSVSEMPPKAASTLSATLTPVTSTLSMSSSKGLAEEKPPKASKAGDTSAKASKSSSSEESGASSSTSTKDSRSNRVLSAEERLKAIERKASSAAADLLSKSQHGKTPSPSSKETSADDVKKTEERLRAIEKRSSAMAAAVSGVRGSGSLSRSLSSNLELMVGERRGSTGSGTATTTTTSKSAEVLDKKLKSIERRASTGASVTGKEKSSTSVSSEEKKKKDRSKSPEKKSSSSSTKSAEKKSTSSGTSRTKSPDKKRGKSPLKRSVSNVVEKSSSLTKHEKQ